MKGFICEAPLHTVNESSTIALREKVLGYYKTEEERSKIEVESLGFRPNFIIETGTPYEEDAF
jgi:hypothetical protein